MDLNPSMASEKLQKMFLLVTSLPCMKAGIVGLLNSVEAPIDKVIGTANRDGIDYQYCIKPDDTFRPDGLGKPVQTGEAALEIPEQVDQKLIENDDIIEETRTKTRTIHTHWLLIPDEIAVIENSDGQFFYDLLGAEFNCDANRAKLDLTSMRSDYEDTALWQAGFYDRLGTAQKGVVYGEDVLDDEDIGDPLRDAQINQLGLEYEYDGNQMKITLTESGYIEVYQPTEFDSGEFATYLQNQIRQYVAGIYAEGLEK